MNATMIDPYVYCETTRLPMCGICCKRAASVEMTEWRHFPDCGWLAKYQSRNNRRGLLAGWLAGLFG